MVQPEWTVSRSVVEKGERRMHEENVRQTASEGEREIGRGREKG